MFFMATKDMERVGLMSPHAFALSPNYSHALSDIVQGARAYDLWGTLAWQDVLRRYRRSTLGPWWITMSMGMLVGVLGALYAGLFKVETAQYLPFLSLGFIVWGLLSGLITEGCAAFVASEAIIKQVRLPLSVHVYRVVWRNLLILFHNSVIFVVVAVLFSVWPGWAGTLAVPGLVLVGLNGMWVGLLLGLVSSRFRDVPEIVGSVMRIAFFVTPIIWMPELMPGRALMLDLNPFFHFLEVIRAPLLGQVPGFLVWSVVVGISLGGWGVTLAIYSRYRGRIAYWV